MEQTRFCPECNAEIDAAVSTCPSCGYPLEATATPFEPAVQTKVTGNKRIIGMVMCIAALICIIIGITRVTNSSYRFYEQHLSDCLDGYADVKASAVHAPAMFAYTYQLLAESYEDMIEKDRKELWSYRIQAIVYCGAGAVLAVLGVPKLKQEEYSNGTDQLS